MANTTIKITQLPSIGNGLSASTILPVVNTSGTAVTEKVTVGAVANYVLTQAGNTLSPAFLSTIAYSVSNASQPNITSVGTLSVDTLKITGGIVGYYLQTDGSGNLAWAPGGGGNGAVGGINTQVQFNDAGNFGGNTGFTFNKTTGVFSSPFLAGNGNGLSNIQAANVTGLGNIATINLTGSTSNVLYGNGVFASIAGAGATGATGPAGVNGATGATGPAGTNGSDGATGATGPQGDVGATGVQGATGAIGNTLLANLDANGFFISNAANITANYFVGVATDVVVEAVNNNYSYHMAFVTGSGDTTLHMDADDNLQYNPQDGTLTVVRIDPDYLNVHQSVVSNLNPFSNVTYNLGNSTNRWKDIYLANSTIYLGDATLSANGNSIVVDSITVTNGNVGTVGNIASLNLDGNSGNVLYGNGVFASVAGAGATGATGPAGSNGSDGATGASGPGFVWQGAWQPAPTTYVGGQDVVSYAGSSYIKIGNGNSGSAPPDDPVRWSVMAEEGAVGETGATGANGSDGATGATGPAGTNGSDGATGATGPQGDTGATGPAGSGANTGNVTFDNVTVQGVNGLNLSAGSDFTANLAYLQVRAGDVASHIHLDTGNNSAYDLIVGDDQNYVQVSSTGNILLSAYDSNTSQYTWTLDYNGNLILAGGNSVIQSIANSSLDPTLPNVSTMVLTPDQNYNSQSLVLDPTLPGHIHLRAYAFSNIDEPSANIFLGGENTAFEITEGANNQAVIHSNGKAWTFGNDGNISSDTLTFTTTFANVKTVEYQTAGVWDLYVEDSITGSNTASSRLNVSFKDNLIDKPQVYIENTKESDGIALRWTFDENGNLNFPRDVAGNSDPYLNIFGGSTPTIQSTDVSLGGPANLAIQSDYLNLSGSTGNRIILQADAGAIATDANMVLSTNLADLGNVYSWTFSDDGLLTLPGGNVVIGSLLGSEAILASNIAFGVVSQGNGSTVLQWIDDVSNASALSAIYINSPSGNTGDVAVLTGEPGANANIWTFGNNGNLTLPTSGHIIVSGGLVSSGASPAPTINGFSITNSVGISGNGNIAGNNISATGNVTAQGVGTNLVRRANTISGSNTAVTLDNLTALVGGTPKRLYIGAATSNMTMAGQSQTMSTGALAVSSWINVPIVTGTGNGFAMSGAITNDGDTAVLNVTDQGAGSGTWRVTGMIANTSANLYSVSIERLA